MKAYNNYLRSLRMNIKALCEDNLLSYDAFKAWWRRNYGNISDIKNFEEAKTLYLDGVNKVTKRDIVKFNGINHLNFSTWLYKVAKMKFNDISIDELYDLIEDYKMVVKKREFSDRIVKAGYKTKYFSRWLRKHYGANISTVHPDEYDRVFEEYENRSR